MNATLVRHDQKERVFFFMLAGGRRRAVSELEAEYSRVVDNALTSEATLLERARWLAENTPCPDT